MFLNDGCGYKIDNFLCDSSSNKKVLKLKQGDQNVKYCIPPFSPFFIKGPLKRNNVFQILYPPSSLSSSRGHCKDLDIIFVKEILYPSLTFFIKRPLKIYSFARYCTPFPFRHREPGATEITILWPNNTTFAHNSGRVVTFSKTEKPDEKTWGAHCWSFTPAKSFFENRKE